MAGPGFNIREYQNWVWQQMEAKGFHDGRTGDGRDDTLVRLCLIHTEVSEAAQLVKRHGVTASVRDELVKELADVQIRLLDLAECLNMDLATATEQKMAENMLRPHKYGTPDAGKEAGK